MLVFLVFPPSLPPVIPLESSVSQPVLPRDPKCRTVIWARPQPLNTPTSVLYVGEFGQHFSVRIIPIPRNIIKNNDEINWTNFFIKTVEYIFWPWTEILVLENTIIFQKQNSKLVESHATPLKSLGDPKWGCDPELRNTALDSRQAATELSASCSYQPILPVLIVPPGRRVPRGQISLNQALPGWASVGGSSRELRPTIVHLSTWCPRHANPGITEKLSGWFPPILPPLDHTYRW